MRSVRVALVCGALALALSAPGLAGDMVRYETPDGRTGYATRDRVPADARVVDESPGGEISDSGSGGSGSALEGLCDQLADLPWEQRKAFVRASLTEVDPASRRECLQHFAGLLVSKFEANCALGIHSDREAWLDALHAQARDCNAMGR